MSSVIDLRNQEAEAQLLQENNQPSFGGLGAIWSSLFFRGITLIFIAAIRCDNSRFALLK
jgi:hypothetical protein